jgi:hypothetical protein
MRDMENESEEFIIAKGANQRAWRIDRSGAAKG